MQRLLNESETSTTVSELCAEYRANNRITRDEYEYYDVKRGLRNRDGTGVVAGLTHVCNVHGYLIDDGEKVPDEGRLSYRGLNVTDIVNGCDCSYFTQWCYKQAGIDIPRQSEAQRAFGTSIPISEAQPGDIVWRHGHVGIFIDENTVIEQTPPYCRVNSITYENWTCAVRITG